MKKYQRLISVILLISLIACSLAACDNAGGESQNVSQGDSTEDSGSSNDDALPAEWDEDPAQIKWVCWVLRDMPGEAALKNVTDALNEILLKKINVQVEIEYMDMGTYMTQVPMMITSGEKLDLITTFPAASASYAPLVSQGQLLPLTDMVNEYAPEILELLPAQLLEATTKNGELYGVSVYQNFMGSSYWMARKSIFDTLGIDEESVETLDDIYEVLLTVKEQYPELYPLSGNAKTALPGDAAGADAVGQTYFDILGDSLGVSIVQFSKEDNDMKVVNNYETPEMQATVDLIKKWYDEGLVDKDVAMKEDEDPAKNQKAFSWFAAGNNARIFGYETLAGEDLVMVKLMDSVITTADCVRLTMAVPVSATEPEAAVKFMNLLYTDPEIKNLVTYGIEGYHYSVDETGVVELLDSEDGGYNPGNRALAGNSFLAYTENGVDPAIAVMDTESMENAEFSPLIGFAYDTSVKSEINAQLNNIFNEYVPGLRCGSAKDSALEEFNQKMYDAGLQEYIDEAQAQLDAWLAEKN